MRGTAALNPNKKYLSIFLVKIISLLAKETKIVYETGQNFIEEDV
jgi:hypothetical protein